MKPILFAAACAAVLASAPARAQTSAEFAATTVNLSAIGDVKVTPDRATLNLGVNVQAPTAAEAMGQNAAQMAAVIAALKKAGVLDRAIRTQGLNLQPQYVFAPNQPQRLTGYRATNTVSVTVEDMGKTGGLLDAAVAAGANQVTSILFSLKNAAAAQDQARTAAIRELKAKAELYAQANGLKVARLVRMAEGPGSPVLQPFGLNEVVVSALQSAPPPAPLPIPPVAAGEMDVRVQVSATYELTR